MFRLEEIIDGAVAELLEKIKAKEPKLYERILQFVGRMDSKGGGFLSNTANARSLDLLEKYIQGVLEDLGINKDVADFVKNFDEAAKYTIGLQKTINGISVPATDVLRRWREYAIRTTVENLVGNGLSATYSKTIEKILGDAVYSGGSLTDVYNQVRAYAVTDTDKNGGLLKHYQQVSRDAVGQYAGGINRIVAKQYGLDALEYVGSLVKDSRPQCIRWVGMETILVKDLAKEITWAENNGQGLIPGTNADNFVINRGGFNCRHEAIPTRSKK